MKIVTDRVIHYLAEAMFTTIDDLNTAVAEQVDAINDRTPFRGEARSRSAWFTDAEAGELLDLLDQPWVDVTTPKREPSQVETGQGWQGYASVSAGCPEG
ncbi:hypothetical protein ACTXJM_10000 [Corynebacterium variabile]|uniref:hypothetical protein n=1 Tax=Corynebacterium variabile TaxID=1727 RepID=UPI003FD2E1A0